MLLSGLKCSNLSNLSLSRLWARSVAIELLRTIDAVGEMRVSLVLLETAEKREKETLERRGRRRDDGAPARKLLLRSLQVEMVIGIGSDLASELEKPSGLSGSSRMVGES